MPSVTRGVGLVDLWCFHKDWFWNECFANDKYNGHPARRRQVRRQVKGGRLWSGTTLARHCYTFNMKWLCAILGNVVFASKLPPFRSSSAQLYFR